MNIFNLRGPEFLALYLIFSILVLFITYYLIENSEKTNIVGKVDFSDPYLISTLRGGKQETIRTVVFSLLDRGFLNNQDKKIIQSSHNNSHLLRKTIEQQVYKEVESGTYIKNLIENQTLRLEAGKYESELTHANLLPSQQMINFRSNVCFLSGLVLISISGLKMFTAVHNGHRNIELLFTMTLLVISFLLKIYNKKRSAIGSAKLEELKNLLYRLTSKAHQMKPNGATNEAVLLVSVFGIAVLREQNFKFLKVFQNLQQRNNLGDSFSTIIFDATSSCGSSCSSCGGGGGCGGCGGGGD